MNRSDQAAGLGAKLDKRIVLFVAAMASFLTPFMSSSINVAIPSIARDFAVDATTLTWIATAYLLAAAMLMIPFGRIGDIYGRQRLFLYGLTGYTIVSLLCGLAISETMLIVLRALQGLTDAMMFGTSMALVTSVYPPNERGRALGITAAAVYAGLSLGPFIGGSITHFLGWRSIFFFTTALGLLTVVLTYSYIRAEWADARGEKLDVVGSVLYGLTLLAVMNGFSLLPDKTGLWLILAGVACLAAFVLWESHVSSPVLDMGLFRHNTTFALSSLSSLINYSATYAVTFLLSLYLQYIKGLDPNAAGIILLSQPVIMTVFSPLTGRLSDRIEPRILASTGMAVTTIGLVLIVFLDSASSLANIVLTLIVCGLGFSLFASPNANALMGSVNRTRFGMAAATTSAMRLSGQMLSMGIAALIIAVYVGKVQITPQYYPAFQSGFRTAFIVFVILCLGGIFASYARGNIHAQAPAGPPTLGSLHTKS